MPEELLTGEATIPDSAPADTAPSSEPAPAETTPTLLTGEDGTETQTDTKDAPAEPDPVPEKYEFTMPENVQMDEGAVNAFSEFAKEAGLSQEAAQKMIDKMAPAMQARQAEALNAARESWGESSKTDKEFGGEKLNENLSVAKKAMDAFGTPELRTLLNESGLGNHPEIIRAFYRAGKSISEDRFVPSGAGGRTGGKDPASSLYPNQ